MDRDESIKAVNKATLDNIFWFVAFLTSKVMAMDGMQNALPISDTKTKNSYLVLLFLETICNIFTVAEIIMLLKLFYLRLRLETDITAYIKGEPKDFLKEAETCLGLRKIKPSKILDSYRHN